MAIAGVGWLAYIKDPDGNLLGMMQANPAAKWAATLAPAQVPGSCATERREPARPVSP